MQYIRMGILPCQRIAIVLTLHRVRIYSATKYHTKTQFGNTSEIFGMYLRRKHRDRGDIGSASIAPP